MNPPAWVLRLIVLPVETRGNRRANDEFDHAGCTVRVAAVEEDADVCADSDRDARTGHRREYGDFYRVQPGAAANASGGEAERIGAAEICGLEHGSDECFWR